MPNCSAASRAPGNQLRLEVLGKSNPIFSTMLLQRQSIHNANVKS
jgi:hypothetical protein